MLTRAAERRGSEGAARAAAVRLIAATALRRTTTFTSTSLPPPFSPRCTALRHRPPTPPRPLPQEQGTRLQAAVSEAVRAARNPLTALRTFGKLLLRRLEASSEREGGDDPL